MADLTQNAVDGLLGLLTSAIKDEVRLQGGVHGNIQFIKDELDSMNGFLLHLTKTETAHNDQHRAWMKQVRDIAYIAHDSIELYMRDLSPPEGGFCASVAHLPVLLWTYPKRRNLAKQLHELKDRVREVGERRLRYGVSVPDDAKLKPEPVVKDSNTDEKREEFLHALEEDARASPPSFSKAINLLPGGLPSKAHKTIDKILNKCVHVDSKKMFLCALFAYPHLTKEEETNLKKKLVAEGRRAVDVSKEVMLFSYSKLSRHYKSCLQYLTAFHGETSITHGKTSISRTSLVRRWVAEGLVASDDGLQNYEEAGERCFNELVFRGFVRPEPPVIPGQKIKRWHVEESVWEFVFGMAKSENFVGALPTHLLHQRKIREIAKRIPPQQQSKQRPCPSWNICPRKQQLLDDDNNTAAQGKRHPMDDMAFHLKTLPEEYRLNVLDLEGCRALKDRHLKSIITKVPWLKYLSIRKTDVSRLPKEINNLRRLETLDIRQTKIKDSGTTHINLPMLKHLLAGNIIQLCHETESLITVQMPRKIAKSTEILRYVQILKGKTELEDVGNLKQLRKLGVVIQGNEDNMKHLNRTISKLGECLRSLSVWINEPNLKDTATGDGSSVGLGGNTDGDAAVPSSPHKNLESLNMKYFRGHGLSPSVCLPGWLSATDQLDRLSKITLRDTQLLRSSLQTLGKLQSLCCLRLRRGSYTEDSITLGTGDFQKLRFLLVDQVSPTTIKIEFQADAAPKLEKIAWTFDKEIQIKEDTISGINNLQSLKELELHGTWNDEEGHVKKALDKHRNQPKLTP